MQGLPAAETIEAPGCTIVLRRVVGPEATEFHLLAQPLAADARTQTQAVYGAIAGVLQAEGAGWEALVAETLFLRSLSSDLDAVRTARRRILDASARPARTEIEQPPLNPHAHLEVAVHASVPRQGSPRVDTLETRPHCPCPECTPRALRVRTSDETSLRASGLYGRGGNAYEQTLAMFGVAEDLLRQAGMEFRDVVRTWIHLREMDRDYPALNRARREFFEARGVDPPPASTGIGGAPPGDAHDLCLGVYAVGGSAASQRSVMTTPTLNDAPIYGSDFVRGMRLEDANKVALHVSGTASIDEAGRTVHDGDLDAQVERMLLNIEKLLERQGAGFRDIVSAVTYLKEPSDAARLESGLRNGGFEGFPNARVAARVCRPDLLCEAEVLAVLPKPSA